MINSEDIIATFTNIYSSTSLPCSLLCLGQTLGDILPVDDIPNGIDVVRSQIFVLQIVRMLPNVDSEQRDQA